MATATKPNTCDRCGATPAPRPGPLCIKCDDDLDARHGKAVLDAMESKNERLAERLMKMAAKRSTETAFGWTHPDCEVLQAAASTLRGAPERRADPYPVGVLSKSTSQ